MENKVVEMKGVEKNHAYFLSNGYVVKKDRFTGESRMLCPVTNTWEEISPEVRDKMKKGKTEAIDGSAVEAYRTAIAVCYRNSDSNAAFRVDFFDTEFAPINEKIAAILCDTATRNHAVDFSKLTDVIDRDTLALAYRSMRKEGEGADAYIARVSKDHQQKKIVMKTMEYRLKYESPDEKASAALNKFHGMLAVA